MKKVLVLIFVCLIFLCSCYKKNDVASSIKDSVVTIDKVDITKDFIYENLYKSLYLTSGEEYSMIIPTINLNSDDASNINLELKNDIINSYKKYKLSDNIVTSGDLIYFDYYILDDYLSLIEYKKSYISQEIYDSNVSCFVVKISDGKLLSNNDLLNIYDLSIDDIYNIIAENIYEDSDYIISLIKENGFSLYINSDNRLVICYNEATDFDSNIKELVID